MTLRRLDFTSFGADATFSRLVRFSPENATSRVRWNGPIDCAILNACSAGIPLGRELGSAVADRCAPAAVVANAAGRNRARDGSKPDLSVATHSIMLTWGENCFDDGIEYHLASAARDGPVPSRYAFPAVHVPAETCSGSCALSYLRPGKADPR